MFVDLIYVNNETFFVSLSEPLDLLMIRHLPHGKTGSVLKKVIKSQLGEYRGEGFHVFSVTSDNEPAMIMKDTVNAYGAKLLTGGIKAKLLTGGMLLPNLTARLD